MGSGSREPTQFNSRTRNRSWSIAWHNVLSAASNCPSFCKNKSVSNKSTRCQSIRHPLKQMRMTIDNVFSWNKQPSDGLTSFFETLLFLWCSAAASGAPFAFDEIALAFLQQQQVCLLVRNTK